MREEQRNSKALFCSRLVSAKYVSQVLVLSVSKLSCAVLEKSAQYGRFV